MEKSEVGVRDELKVEAEEEEVLAPEDEGEEEEDFEDEEYDSLLGEDEDE